METNNKYKDLSKEELLQRIEEVEAVMYQMEIDRNEAELLSFPWIGNLGQWHWMIQSDEVVFNEKKATNLGYDKIELPKNIGFEFFTTKLHPGDYERVMDNMTAHLSGQSDAYEVEYRIRTKDGNYVWYYDIGKIVSRNEKGEPLVISGIVFDISKNKIMEDKLNKANEKLQQLVNTDELTGVYNRRFMVEKINNEINRFDRTKLLFSLIMLDIDDFKIVNDKFGHNVGDIVLKKIVEIIQKRIRKTDFLCRWGGDEFVILLTHTKVDNASKLADDMRAELSNTKIEGVGKVTASFGVTDCCDNDNIDSIIKKADDLMYKAKSEGGNCIRY